jgi:chaperone required for assembly of F1-ATPase
MELQHATTFAKPCSSTSIPIASGLVFLSFIIYTYSPNLLWISFHQDYPEPLVRLQNDHWIPLLTWARDTFDVELLTSGSVLFSAQPLVTKRKFDKVLQGFDPWQMAGLYHYLLSPMIYSKMTCGQRWSV